MRISLFIACYNDTLFAENGIAVVRVLSNGMAIRSISRLANLLRPDAL
jgi:hypothetical protein